MKYICCFQDGEPASRKQRSPIYGADPWAAGRTEDELLLFLERDARQPALPLHPSVFHVFYVGALRPIFIPFFLVYRGPVTPEFGEALSPD